MSADRYCMQNESRGSAYGHNKETQLLRLPALFAAAQDYTVKWLTITWGNLLLNLKNMSCLTELSTEASRQRIGDEIVTQFLLGLGLPAIVLYTLSLEYPT